MFQRGELREALDKLAEIRIDDVPTMLLRGRIDAALQRVDAGDSLPATWQGVNHLEGKDF